MSEDPEIMICAPADAPLAAAGSVFNRICSRCERQVMVAPSGQALLKRLPNIEIMCMICYYRNVDEDHILQPAASIEEVAAEARSARPNTWRRRN